MTRDPRRLFQQSEASVQQSRRLSSVAYQPHDRHVTASLNLQEPAHISFHVQATQLSYRWRGRHRLASREVAAAHAASSVWPMDLFVPIGHTVDRSQEAQQARSPIYRGALTEFGFVTLVWQRSCRGLFPEMTQSTFRTVDRRSRLHEEPHVHRLPLSLGRAGCCSRVRRVLRLCDGKPSETRAEKDTSTEVDPR